VRRCCEDKETGHQGYWSVIQRAWMCSGALIEEET
jgi:hypothetical protein